MIGYEIFDDIICITLEGNTERQRLAKETFTEIGIEPRFYVAKRSPRGGRVGCFESHINVINDCYNKGYERILIFEDDVVTTLGYNNKLVNEACTFMKTNEDWDIFQFGYSLLDTDDSFIKTSMKYLISERVSPNIYKSIGILTQSYCLSRSGMSKVLKNIEVLNLPDDQVPHFDRYLIKTLYNENCYIIAPELFDQRWCLGTDNKSFNLTEIILRKGQCLLENNKVTYILSLVLLNRVWIITLIIIIFILIINSLL
jgi:GR25 family glycosyltransferase involved in LPS biosynthesis